MINARFESVADKPAFRRAFAARRCLLPADGFYEWYETTGDATAGAAAKGKPVKQPFFIHPADGGLFVMAGLYEFWKAPDTDWLVTCTVITTRATDELGHIHDRMPMVVPHESWDDWLDPGYDKDARDLLRVPAPELEAYLVSRAVNRVANNSPDLTAPVADS